MAFPANRSTPLFAQRVPRGASRFDKPTLALGDAGHGSAPDTRNPLLYGLAVSMLLRGDAFTRTLRLYVQAAHPSTGVLTREEVTSLLRIDAAARRYTLQGILGVAPFGIAAFSASDFDAAARKIEFIVVARNATLEIEQRYEMYVRGTVPIAHCPESSECDFAFLKPLAKAGVRPFNNIMLRTDNTPVSFYFAQLDALIARVPSLPGILTGYSAHGTVGIEFNNAGACGVLSEGGQPACAALHCCCSIEFDLIEVELSDITTPAQNPLSGGSTIILNDVIDVVVTVPTVGSAECIGFDSLVVALPGLDTTGGVWSLFDPVQVGGFMPTATLDGAPVLPAFSQNAVDGGDGTGESGALDFTGIHIACGATLVLNFRLVARLLSGTEPVSMGAINFSDGGPCSPGADAGAHLPALKVAEVS